MIDDVKEAAQGHWEHILVALNLDASLLTRPNVKCPLCPESTDSFSFTDHEGHGKWLCRKCGRGDGFDLLQRLNDWDFRKAKAEVQRVLGAEPIKPPFKPKRDPAPYLNRLWLESRPVRKNDEVHRYLQGRGLSALPPSLRYHPGLKVDGFSYPAMLAMFVDVNGRPESWHKTFIVDGQKAPLERPKRVATPKTTITGCAIRLWPATDAVVLTEGIESAVAAHEIYDLPAWACWCAHGLENVQLPKQIRRVIVCGDNDEHKEFDGNAAATNLARRLVKEGRQVKLYIPPLPGQDMADVIKQLLRPAA